MPTKVFLANPNLPDKVGEIFRLNETEMDTIRSLVPKMELSLKRAGTAAILRLRSRSGQLLALHLQPP